MLPGTAVPSEMDALLPPGLPLAAAAAAAPGCGWLLCAAGPEGGDRCRCCCSRLNSALRCLAHSMSEIWSAAYVALAVRSCRLRLAPVAVTTP
jgi:hypothetical protein